MMELLYKPLPVPSCAFLCVYSAMSHVCVRKARIIPLNIVHVLSDSTVYRVYRVFIYSHVHHISWHMSYMDVLF